MTTKRVCCCCYLCKLRSYETLSISSILERDKAYEFDQPSRGEISPALILLSRVVRLKPFD